MEQVRKLNLMFNKGGSGSETARLALPTTWVKEMGLDKEEKSVIAIAKQKHILIRKASEEKKYLVIATDGINEDVEVYDTLEDANSSAESHWQSYTSHEKKKSHIQVGYVTEEMLAPDAFDENGDVEDWTAYWNLDWDETYFNSDNL